ncbi:MAG: putative Ig domain-containing protein, partial [Proteobacteria bacterium]|nr:putative Ig domain-containing protein [Pseudomonadota bacterium]
MVISQAAGGSNQPPAFTPIPDQTVSEGETLVFIIRAVDSNGDPVGYFASLLPAGAVFFKETGKFKWIPDYDQAGDYRVVFSASDGKAVSSITVDIRVLNTNRVPTLEVAGRHSVFEGGELVLQLVGADPDEDPLSFAFTPSLRGAILYPQGSTAAWIWHPNYDQAGSYREVFTVTDLSDPPLTASIALDLVVDNTNRPPVLAGVADQVVSEGQFLDFWLTAADPDGDNVTYAAGPMPRGSTLNVNTGEFFWVPDYDQAGDYPLTVTAIDDGDPRLSDSRTIMITVLNVNRPPVITAFSASPSSLNTGGTVNFSVTAHDPDGDPTIAGYDWDFDGNGTWDLPTTAGSIPYIYIYNGFTVNGNYTVRVRVVDDGGLTAEATTTVRVKPGAADLLLSQVMKSGTAMGIYLEVIGGTPPAGYLYIADGQAGMEIFSVPNLNNPDPILISRTGVVGDSRNVFIYNKHAYLALNTNSGAEVIDVNNPSTPLDLGSIFSNNLITDIFIKKHFFDQKDYFFFSKYSSLYGLYVYDLENQGNPIVKVQNEDQVIRDFWAVDMDDKMNVFTASQYGMEIFNFQIPPGNSSHFFDKEIKISDVAYDVESKHHSNGSDYVYLLAKSSKLIIYSYSPIDPISTITETSRLATYSCTPERVAVTSAPDLAYITVGSCGYQIASLSDPGHPLMLIPSERFDPCTAPGCSEHFYQMVNYGDFSFIGGGSWGLVVTANQLSGNPPATANPIMITSYNTSGYPTDLQAKGSRLFLTLGRGEMDVYNLESPE